jgi:hypothetical protein
LRLQGGVRWLTDTGWKRGETHHPCNSVHAGMGDVQGFLERIAFPSKQVTVSRFGQFWACGWKSPGIWETLLRMSS